MPAISNQVIEAISIKEMPQPDTYGNTYRANFKIGEDWYSYGAIKKDAINVKVGSDWVQLQKGMTVEFMYQQNGDWKNVNKKSFTITDASGGQAPAPKQQQSSTPKQQSGGGSFVNPAEVGQCLNLAAEVLKLKKADLTSPEKVKEAIAWYKEVRELFTELYPTVEASSKPKPKAKPPVEDEPPFDKDIEMDYDDESI